MIINYVEDEKELADLIYKYLVKEGYEVNVFYDGETAEKHIKDEVDLWILDIMLPGNINGFDLIEMIREQNPEQLVIFTSARDSDIDKVLGLESGSDDYIAKPFSPKELVLRVNNILKRAKKLVGEIIKYQDYEINLVQRTVKENKEIIDLTYKEFELLDFLLRKKDQEISRTDVLEAIWKETDNTNTRVVDDLLRRLRQKMPKLRVETIYGFGYRLV